MGRGGYIIFDFRVSRFSKVLKFQVFCCLLFEVFEVFEMFVVFGCLICPLFLLFDLLTFQKFVFCLRDVSF